MLDKRKRRVGLRQSCCHFRSTNFKSLQKSAECSFFEAPFPLGVCCPHVFALLPPQPLPIMACLGSSRNRCGLRTLNEIGSVKTWHARFLFWYLAASGGLEGPNHPCSVTFSWPAEHLPSLIIGNWLWVQPGMQLTVAGLLHLGPDCYRIAVDNGWWRYHPTVLHAPDLASTCNTVPTGNWSVQFMG